MTPKPKAVPFAEVRLSPARDGEEHVIAVDVGGFELFDADDMGEEEMVRVATRLTEAHELAVAAREASLVAALETVVKFDDTAWGNTEPWPSFRRVATACRAALEGTGPEFVAELRAQVEALKATSGPWALLADVVQEGGLASERAAALMKALGLSPPKPVLADVSDGALQTEMDRRHALSKVEHIFETHDYGWREPQGDARGHQTITGRSYCGMALEYGGHWSAITPDQFMSNGPNMRTCIECGMRFGPWRTVG